MKEKESVILSTAYFPPIQYYSKILNYKNIIIEADESYLKQSYRNRCNILSANGAISLIIPIEKSNLGKNIKDTKIEYCTAWQREHLQAIKSAYKSSAYYDYYIDDLMMFFEREEKFLLDFNLKIISEINKIIGIERNIELSNKFLKEYLDISDYRYTIHPKASQQKEDKNFNVQKYYQVFSDKFDFIENLSILDLIFNEGPLSYEILKKSIPNQI